MASPLWRWLSSRAMTRWSPCCWRTIPRARCDCLLCTSPPARTTPRPRPCSCRTTTTPTWSRRWGRNPDMLVHAFESLSLIDVPFGSFWFWIVKNTLIPLESVMISSDKPWRLLKVSIEWRAHRKRSLWKFLPLFRNSGATTVSALASLASVELSVGSLASQQLASNQQLASSCWLVIEACAFFFF